MHHKTEGNRASERLCIVERRREAMRILVVAIVTALVAPAAIANAGEGDDAPAPNPATCVKVRTSARYVAYGYDHVVELENTCDKAMRCEVSTDVNPTPATVDLATGETKSVLTYRGSPASEFKAQVDCKQQ